MLWSKAIIIVILEILLGFVFGRIMIPYFRKLKTGKFEINIGDRFKKDGSEPAFGGVVIVLSVIFGFLLTAGMVNGSHEIYGYFALTGFSLILMIIGCCEDYLKDVKKSLVGIKKSHKVILEYVICLAFLLILKGLGQERANILLPFRLGFLSMGVAYYPIMAFFMTVMINAVKVHNYFGEDKETSVDGLCAISSLIYFLFFSVYGNIQGNEMVSAVGYVFSAGCIGYLIWGISPSKLQLGESGVLFLGGLISGLAIVSGLHLVILFAGFTFLIDSISSLVGYIFYRKTKRILFMGSSLHSHFKAKGYNDYKIILIFSLVGILSGVVGVLFVIYSMRLI